MTIKPNLTPISAERNGKLPSGPDYLAPFNDTDDSDGGSSQQFLALLKRKAILIAGVAIATTSLVGVAALQQKPEYKGNFQILVEAITAENIEKLSANNGNPLPEKAPNSSGGLDYPTQIGVLYSPKLLDPSITEIKKRYPDVSYEDLKKQLKIERPQDTKIISVTYKYKDLEQVKFVLNKLAEDYLVYSQKQRQSNLRQGIEFADKQIAQTQERVDVLQRQLQDFRERNNLADPEAQINQVTAKMDTLAQQRLATQKELAEAQRNYSILQENAGATSTLAANTAYQSLLLQIRDIDSKIAVESARFQDDNPAIEALQVQKQNLMPLLRQEARRVLGNKMADIETQLSLLTTRQQSIDTAESFLQQQGSRLPALVRLFTDLQRDLTVATDSLKRFLSIRESLQVDVAQKEVPWQLINPPGAFEKDDPRPRNLMFGALAGLLLGIITAVMAEKLDSRVRSVDDLKQRIKLPLLGAIPYYKELRERSPIRANIAQQLQAASLGRLFSKRSATSNPGSYPASSFLEAFRSLRTNLRLLGTESPITSLVISSAQSGEGKSTVATHLAWAAAAMGQRVLLVDADFRNPQIGNLLGLSDETGLSDLITDDLNLNQVIQEVRTETFSGNPQTGSSVGENLFVLLAGNIPADPTKLLSSEKLPQLTEQFKALFDLVIYDTPPLINLADSSLLAVHTDGMILVAGLGQTDRATLNQALENVKISRIPIWGVVANSSRPEH
jgi:polysaccharide biosynthesis transport protein